jgi:thiol-disulfide isomerase/thioredoxin
MMAGVFLALALEGCGSTKPDSGEKMLLGWVTWSAFDDPRFREGYDTVTVSEDLAGFIGEVDDGVECLVFFGSWCSDSRRQVPRFQKVADLAGMDSLQIRYCGLDRSKRSPDGLAEQYAIELVPTFVFLKEGKEIGRIVEQPKGSMEDDMLAIMAGTPER